MEYEFAAYAKMLTIEDLPDEVMELIFSYLPLRDRKRVRLVNRQWRDLSSSATVVKDDIVVEREGWDLDECTIRRRNFNLRMNIDEYSHLQTFWKEQGGFVKSIEIARIDPDQSTSFFDINNYCPNIRQLSFSVECKIGPIKNRRVKLENLLSLEIRNLDLMSGVGFLVLTRKVPKLKRIHIEVQTCVDNEALVMEAIELLVMRQAHTLKKLNFTNCSFLNEQLLKTIVEKLGPQITSFHIPGCPGNTYRCVEIIANKFVNLEELDFSFTNSLTSRNVLPVLSTLKNLKLISFRGNKINDEVLASVATLKHLRGLDITACKYLTAEGISNAFKEKRHLELFDLRLNYNLYVTDDVLESLLPQFPNLKCLYLDNCTIGTKGISAIVNNCKLLRCLSLKHCDKIEDIIQPVSINCLKGLIHLSVNGCVGLNEDTIGDLQLMELQTIDFCDTHLLPSSDEDWFLDALNDSCPSLEGIYVSKTYERKDYNDTTGDTPIFWDEDGPLTTRCLSIFEFSCSKLRFSY